MRDLRFILLAVAIFLAAPDITGQEDVKVIKGEFRTDKPGFENAWKSIIRGDKHYSAGVLSYPDALGQYAVAYRYNSENAELNYKLGVCQLYSVNREEALGYLLKALSVKPAVAGDILLHTGRAYQYNGNFIEAIGKYTEFMSSENRKKPQIVEKIKKYIDECNAGMLIIGDTARIDISNAGEAINSPFDDYSPVFSPDGKKFYFASRRPVQNAPLGKYSDALPDENIFIVTKSGEAWGKAFPLEGKLNTRYCEAPLSLTDNGNKMLIYTGYRGDGDIFETVLKKGVWTKPRSVGGRTNTQYPETSIAYSPDGKEVVFVSSRKKAGAGGKDIYLSRRIKGNRWSKPVNLSILNSPFDEESVVYSSGGDTLWFSSRGHGTIGGFDIFFSVRQADGSWGSPVNAGLPVNSVHDDIYYVPDRNNDSIFWFVSNRTGGFGGLDIYIGRLLPPEPGIVPEPEPEPEPEIIVPEPQRVVDTVFVIREVVRDTVAVIPEPEFFLEGRVLDSVEETPLAARIDIIDPETHQVIASYITPGQDGSFRVNVRTKKNYMLEIRSNGYLSDMKTLDIPAGYIGKSYFTNFYLSKISVGKKVILNNIFFETGKAVLTPASYAELDKLTMIMVDNPEMRIEISGHTDNTGSAAVNTKLSLDRATAVTQYLLGKGIKAARIETKGYGSSQPVESNDTLTGRAANRRVEFKILEF